MKELNNKVEDLNSDDYILDVIIENEDEIIRNSLYDRGFEKGVNQGFEKGIEQNNIEIAKKLLNKNIDIDIITETTGLSKEKIENLK